VTPRGLFRWGIALLAVALIGETIQVSVMLRFADLPFPGWRGITVAVSVVDMVATFALALGAAMVGAALVLTGMAGDHRTPGDRPDADLAHRSR